MELVHVVVLSVDHILGGKRGKLGPVDVRVLVLRWLPLKVFQQLFIACARPLLAVGVVPPSVDPECVLLLLAFLASWDLGLAKVTRLLLSRALSEEQDKADADDEKRETAS